MADRKTSPLAGGGAPWEDEQPSRSFPLPNSDTADTSTDQRKQAPPEPKDGPSITPIREGRRKRSSRKLDDFDLVSFNCNLPVVTRRAVRAFAAEHDADVQDIVNDAVIRYLAEWGVEVPRTRAERDRLRREQR